jgi:hypothetical protein
MKTISLRQFRDSVADLLEPVTVVKREGTEMRTLGTWTPLNVPEAIHAIAGFGQSRPAPKRTK